MLNVDKIKNSFLWRLSFILALVILAFVLMLLLAVRRLGSEKGPFEVLILKYYSVNASRTGSENGSLQNIG